MEDRTKERNTNRNIRVIVRVRPLNEGEVKHNKRSCIQVESDDMSFKEETVRQRRSPPRQRKSLIPSSSRSPLKALKRGSSNRDVCGGNIPPTNTSSYRVSGQTKEIFLDSRRFEFDDVLGPSTSQEDAYARSLVGESIRNHLFNGIHTTVLAYGQTGSGKTFTIGPCVSNTTSQGHASMQSQDGIVARAIHDVFQTKKRYESSGNTNVTVKLQCLELCNEVFRDLLVDDVDEGQDTVIKLRNCGQKEVVIEGASVNLIENAREGLELVQEAATRRATSCTLLNAHSSRSHAIYCFEVQVHPSDPSQVATAAKLTLVDLAGSEQIKKSGVVGSQQKESISINRDLFVLGKVVSALSEQNSKEYVPYRDSKLTQLLQGAIGGNCSTVLIACVSPSQRENSLQTLRYAERSRYITNKLEQNTNLSETQLLRAEISRLQNEVESLRGQSCSFRSPQSNSPSGPSFASLQEKLNLAKQEARTTRERIAIWTQQRSTNSCQATHETTDKVSYPSACTRASFPVF